MVMTTKKKYFKNIKTCKILPNHKLALGLVKKYAKHTIIKLKPKPPVRIGHMCTTVVYSKALNSSDNFPL